MQRHPAKCVKRMIETLLFVDRDGSFRILNKTDHWCVSSVLTHHSDKPKCHQFHKVFRKWRGFIARIFLEILSLCSVPRSLLFRIVFLRSSYRVSELFGTICWMSKQSRWFRQFDINTCQSEARPSYIHDLAADIIKGLRFRWLWLPSWQGNISWYVSEFSTLFRLAGLQSTWRTTRPVS